MLALLHSILFFWVPLSALHNVSLLPHARVFIVGHHSPSSPLPSKFRGLGVMWRAFPCRKECGQRRERERESSAKRESAQTKRYSPALDHRDWSAVSNAFPICVSVIV